MDGFTGYRTATEETLPQARTVMDPFHVVHLAGQKRPAACDSQRWGLTDDIIERLIDPLVEQAVPEFSRAKSPLSEFDWPPSSRESKSCQSSPEVACPVPFWPQHITIPAHVLLQ